MSSNKKPKPLFEVPVEIGSGRESGWVYRSGISAAETTHSPRENTSTNVSAESSRAIALVFATLAQTFVLAITVAILPMTLGMRALRSLAKPNETH